MPTVHWSRVCRRVWCDTPGSSGSAACARFSLSWSGIPRTASYPQR